MTEGVIPVSDLAVNTGANIAAPEITFGEDATYGTYIKRIELGDIVFNFAPDYMFIIGLWDTDEEEFVPLAEAWEPEISEDALSGVITITLELEAPYDGISYVCTMTPISEGYQVSSIVVDNDNATYAAESIEFPRIGCQAPSGTATNAYLAHGFVGGMVIKDPHTYTLNNVLLNALSSPPCMQYLSYWDITTREHLYISTDDEDGCTKHYMIRGDGSSVTGLGITHWQPNPRRAGNGSGVMPYTVPYTTSIELFKGRTEDGRCGFYDAAIRYRTWATNAARPWLNNGPWMDDGNISDRVKDSDFKYISGSSFATLSVQPWTDIVEDMLRCKDIISPSGDMLGLLYSWAENINFLQDFQPPAFTPLIEGGDQNTAMGVASAADLHLSYYTLPAFWESNLAGSTTPFDYSDFEGVMDYGPIVNYIIRDINNVPYEPGPDVGPPPTPGGPFVP